MVEYDMMYSYVYTGIDYKIFVQKHNFIVIKCNSKDHVYLYLDRPSHAIACSMEPWQFKFSTSHEMKKCTVIWNIFTTGEVRLLSPLL